LDFYRTRKFALPVPGKQNFITELRDFPEYLITDLSAGLIGEVSALPNTNMIDSAAIYWHQPYSKSCAFELLQDNSPDLIHDACQFSVRQADILPAYAKVAPGTFVLSNFENIRIVCNGNQTTTKHIDICKPCILHLQCNCALYATGLNLTADSSTCPEDKTFHASIWHPINLALLNKFYDQTNLTISGRDLFEPNETLSLQPIQWPTFAENVSRILASDSQKSYSLNKIANSSAIDSVIFHSSSDALLYEFFTQKFASDTFFHFNPATWVSWAIL